MRYRVPLCTYWALSIYLIAQQHVSNRVLRNHPYRIRPWQGVRFYLDGWSQFDGPEYQRIAARGYQYVPGQRSRVVWFPLYPILMRWLERLVGDFLISGVIISLVAGCAAACLYWAWLTARGMEGRTRLFAFAVLAIYPYGWYLYGAVHSDALFLALVIGAFLLIERDHLVWAGIVGAFATATRPTGIPMLPGLVVMGLQHDGVLVVGEQAKGWVKRFAIPLHFDRSKLRAASFGPALAVLGVGSYAGYLWAKFGDPLIFITNERVYHPGGQPILKKEFIYRWIHFSQDPTYTLTIGFQALIALLLILTVAGVCRRFGFGYGLFLALLVAAPTVSTENFMGTGRYLIAGFPAYAYLGERLAQAKSVRPAVAWFAISLGLLLFMGFLFARSTYLT